MKESEYIIVENLTRIRMMQEIHRSLIPSHKGEIDEAERGELGRLLYKMESRIRGKVGALSLKEDKE